MFSMPARVLSIIFLASITALAAPTIYLAGDSTMAATGGGDGATAGWGSYLPNYVNLTVVNNAIGGRSARSFTREGRFTAMANNVKSGDYVVIEFGHNDGGSLTPTDNGRTDCNPVNNNYATTCQTTYKCVTSPEI
jgi:rhamnogalacturonan acetylesterase